MFQCSNTPMFKCSNVTMFKCSNVQMFKGKMSNFYWSVPPEFLGSFLALIPLGPGGDELLDITHNNKLIVLISVPTYQDC